MVEYFGTGKVMSLFFNSLHQSKGIVKVLVMEVISNVAKNLKDKIECFKSSN